MTQAGIETSDAQPNINSDELETDEELVKKSPALVLARIKWIGNQITAVSNITLHLMIIYVSN